MSESRLEAVKKMLAELEDESNQELANIALQAEEIKKEVDQKLDALLSTQIQAAFEAIDSSVEQGASQSSMEDQPA